MALMRWREEGPGWIRQMARKEGRKEGWDGILRLTG